MTLHSRYWQVDGKAVLNPGPLKEDFDALGWEASFWGLVNSIHLPAGQRPGSAWFLMTREAGDELDKNEPVDITCTHEGGTTTWKNYYPVRSIIVGKDGDAKAPVLVELQDKRSVLALTAANKEYNVRIPVPKGSGVADRYFTDSLSSGTTLFTWQTELDNLWTFLPTGIRGTAPTLAYTPTHSPADHSFLGVNCWYEAIGSLIDFTQSVLTWNPFTDVFALTKLGDAQSGLDTALDAVVKKLMFSDDPRDDINRTSIPEKIRVHFDKRTKYSSSSNLLLPPARSWGGTPTHVRDVATGLTGAEAGTILHIWSDMVAEYDLSGAVLNGTDLNTSGDSLAGEVKNRLNVAGEPLRLIHAGCLESLLTGSEVHEVVWRDYGDAMGMVTEIRARPERYAKIGPRIPVRRVPASYWMLCKPNANIAKGASGAVSVYSSPAGTETDSTEDPTATALGVAVTSGKWSPLVMMDDELYVGCWET